MQMLLVFALSAAFGLQIAVGVHNTKQVKNVPTTLEIGEKGCYVAKNLPEQCKNFKFKTCFVQGDATSCKVDDEELKRLKTKFVPPYSIPKNAPGNPTWIYFLGGLAAGKSHLMWQQNAFLDHKFGTMEISLCYDDYLEALEAFKKGTSQERVPEDFFPPCWDSIKKVYDYVRDYATHHHREFNVYQENYGLFRDGKCRSELQDILKNGYNIKAIFVRNTLEQGLCNMFKSMDDHKRFQSVSDVAISYRQEAEDGLDSYACLNSLSIPKGQTVEWIYCDNRGLQMSCQPAEILTGRALGITDVIVVALVLVLLLLSILAYQVFSRRRLMAPTPLTGVLDDKGIELQSQS